MPKTRSGKVTMAGCYDNMFKLNTLTPKGYFIIHSESTVKLLINNLQVRIAKFYFHNCGEPSNSIA